MALLLRATAGLLLWAAVFSLLYALHGIGCAAGWHMMPLWGASLFRWVLAAAWLLGCLAGLALCRMSWRMPPGFERQLAVCSALAGTAAIVVTGAPAAVLSACL